MVEGMYPLSPDPKMPLNGQLSQSLQLRVEKNSWALWQTACACVFVCVYNEQRVLDSRQYLQGPENRANTRILISFAFDANETLHTHQILLLLSVFAQKCSTPQYMGLAAQN